MKKLMLIILVMIPVMAISQGNKICTIEAVDVVYADSDRVLLEDSSPMFGFIEEVDGYLVIHYHWKEKRKPKQMKYQIVEKKTEGNTVNIFLITHENPYVFSFAQVQYLEDEVRVILTSEKSSFGYKGRK